MCAYVTICIVLLTSFWHLSSFSMGVLGVGKSPGGETILWPHSGVRGVKISHIPALIYMLGNQLRQTYSQIRVPPILIVASQAL